MTPYSPPSSGTGGVFSSSNSPSVALFVDYQNVYLVGKGQFRRPETRRSALLHPGRLADVIDSRRAECHRPGRVTSVEVFRGQPGSSREPRSYARWQASASEWSRDRRVRVRGRPLRYPHDWPAGRAQEKGIDVLLAVSFVRAAILRAADVLILASRDTDLAPALELALDMDDPPIVEVCNWSGRGRLSPHGRAPVWCTYLDESDFLSCLDPRDYRAAGGATA